MKVLASLFVSGAGDDLSAVAGLPIQLAFYKRADFRNFDHGSFVKRLRDEGIKVESVHAPAADVFHDHGGEFIGTIETIKKYYGVDVITVHPQRGTKQHARQLYRKIEERIRELGVIIAYETFEEAGDRRKWITQMEEMHRYFDAIRYDFLCVTYDFTHSSPETNLREIRKFNSRIRAIHLSDALSDRPLSLDETHQHLPLGYGDYPVLEFLKELEDINYRGLVILEYLPQYHHLLKKDSFLLAAYFMGNQEPLREEIFRRRGPGRREIKSPGELRPDPQPPAL